MSESSDQPQSITSSARSTTEGESTTDSRQGHDDDGVHRKKARYSCTFHPKCNQFSWAKPSSKGSTFAFCNRCKRHLNISYGGVRDLKRHGETVLHQEATTSATGSSSLTTYFGAPRGPKRGQAVLDAEVKFGYFIAEHYLAFSVADHC